MTNRNDVSSFEIIRRYHVDFYVDLNLKSMDCSQHGIKLFVTCNCNIMIWCRFLAVREPHLLPETGVCYETRNVFKISVFCNSRSTFSKHHAFLTPPVVELIDCEICAVACLDPSKN